MQERSRSRPSSPGRALVSALALAACGAPPFAERTTPSGVPCPDLPIVPAGQEPDRPYHRLRPVMSEPQNRTEAERLESLRKAACAAGADAVIEAVGEEVRDEQGRNAIVASGTAVVWREGALTGAAPAARTPPVSPTAAPAPQPPVP